MDYVSFKLEADILKQIEKTLKEFNYSTKSDFFREAVREKLNLLEEKRAKKEAWKALFAARGIFKGKSRFKTIEQWHQWKLNNSEKLVKELDKKFKIKS